MRNRLIGCGLASLLTVFGLYGAAAGPLDEGVNSPNLQVRAAALRAASRAATATPGKPTPSPQFISRTTVNNPAADATANDAQTASAAVDLGGGKLVSAFFDRGSPGTQRTGYAWSDDDGLTWTDAGALPASTAGDYGLTPSFAANAARDLYLAVEGFDPGVLQVFKSTNFGHTFAAPVSGIPGLDPEAYPLAPQIAADTFAGAGNGNVYLCALAKKAGGAQGIFFTRSTNGGASFGPTGGLQLSVGGSNCAVTVSPNHSINVFYLRGTGTDGLGGDNKIFQRRSINGGVTFAAETLVADVNTTTNGGQVSLVGGGSTSGAPVAASNPSASRLVLMVAYADIDPANPSTGANIYFTRSVTSGASWSPPVLANDDTAGDQYLPNLAFTNEGFQFMFGYTSRSQDVANIKAHRRGRLGSLNASGGLNPLRPSFQLSPSLTTPNADTGVIGVSEGLAGGAAKFSLTWSDARLSNAFHPRQSDIRFAQIDAVPPPSTSLSLTGSLSSASVQAGDVIGYRLIVAAASGPANDGFVSIPQVQGFKLQSISASGGTCGLVDGAASCQLGQIATGTSKAVQVTAIATAPGATAFRAFATTSSNDTKATDNALSSSVTVTSGSATTSTYSSGDLAVAIPDNGTIDVPIKVRDQGVVLSVATRVRINHTYDSDLTLTLIAPDGETVQLVDGRGGSDDNFGAGANDCTGSPTVLDDAAATAIADGSAPFAGSFKPEAPSSAIAPAASDGVWKLRVKDNFDEDVGVIGCVQLQITRR